MNNLYPFMTKAQIKTRILEDESFALECARIMTSRQTDYEVSAKSTIVKNRAGWMSSHAVFGTKCTEKLDRGEALEPNEVARLTEMVSHYSKQLASHFRDQAVNENPALAAAGRIFGV